MVHEKAGFPVMAKRAKSEEQEAKVAETEEQSADSKPKKRILLVDDDPEIVEAMRYAMESRGYQILVARDGNQGLVMAEREDPDLVILDMMMPKRSGFLVLERLRRTHAVPDARHHDHRQRRQPPQGVRRDAGRGRLHPQAVRHGPARRQRPTTVGLTAAGYRTSSISTLQRRPCL